MTKRQLEIKLQRLKPVRRRISRLEQYSTPATLAADVLWQAYGAGDIKGKAVADLGCGNGIFSIGAKLLGAERVVGIDVDDHAIETALCNARCLALEIEFLVQEVSSFEGTFDTTIQNPPFGAQLRHADKAFIEKAVGISRISYSLHNEVSVPFVSNMVIALGAECISVKRYKFEIPYAFEFHRKAKEVVAVVLLKFQR
ncbi:MAG: 50S ribosomal protein L11 methyltransferase [Methanobacteriota archaeon]|nr:MAG: 50S ribosomal protein L11 methyltransferase [Euryarchaeota archaeon]